MKGKRVDILSSTEREELRRLRKENQKLHQEREVLAKATTWFAKELSGCNIIIKGQTCRRQHPVS